MSGRYYTGTGRDRLKQFVDDCGGIYAAAIKLDIASFFINEALSDGPVPDHILDVIERRVGPIRLTASNFSSNPSPGNCHDDKQNAQIPPEGNNSLEDFVLRFGGVLRASLELGVSTSTIQKLLSGFPVSSLTIKKVLKALSQRSSFTVTKDLLFPLSGTIPQSGVNPSTIRKILDGRPISSATQLKLGMQSEAKRIKETNDDPISFLASRLREIIKSDVDIFDLASKLGVTETSIKKILDGKPVTRPLIEKLRSSLDLSTQDELGTKPSTAVERLRTIHNLYMQLGTLDAVGKHVGLTRERIRQLLNKGKKIGLFEYNPREYPFVSKEKILETYRQTSSLSRVARLNNISTAYLQKLFTAYSITEQELTDCRLEGRRAKCIEQYKNLAEKAGHHLTTTELQSTSEGHSLHSRINRLWGTIDAFRQAINIPIPPKGSPSFRKDTERWREHRHQIAFVSRMQQLDQLREYLDSNGARSKAEVSVSCGLNDQRALELLGLLMKAGEIQRIGQGNLTKYMLTPK